MHYLHRDLYSTVVNSSGGYYALNGSLNIGHTLNNQGFTFDQINDGNSNVIELEVYSVTDGQRIKSLPQPTQQLQPWRKTPEWNEKYLETLTEDIVSFKPSGKLGLSDVRILMLGPVGTGKSSFYNTIDSVFKGRISRSAPCGLSTNCKTIAYTPYEVHVMSGASLNFRLCDTRGLEVTQGLDSVECNYLLDGNISDLYQFNPVAPIRSANPGFVHQPTVEEQFHCVLFLIDAAKVGDIPQKLVDKMHSFQKRVILKG
ncbi:hypothetical protein DPMN_127297 [Dreissena polymorpha]|uniref:Interferon-induced protein 44-like n=1 Tax=Dreissena polymorpha TaxID=45954 RepID=A0A9D4H4Z4_DREPO|nr:hypothetical protein DPMN_127297 [Dreissena polymorpha]